MPFPFEHLDVYKKSLDFVEVIEVLASDLKSKVSYSLIDQLSRAALSIPLNIAEGNGRWHKGEKRQFFWIARGSVFECVPIIQVLHRKLLINGEQYADSLLSGLICNFLRCHCERQRSNLHDTWVCGRLLRRFTPRNRPLA